MDYPIEGYGEAHLKTVKDLYVKGVVGKNYLQIHANINGHLEILLFVDNNSSDISEPNGSLTIGKNKDGVLMIAGNSIINTEGVNNEEIVKIVRTHFKDVFIENIDRGNQNV